MFDLIALVFAVFLLLQLQRVRALLSMTFPELRMRRIAAPRVPEAMADLCAQAAAELDPLGFEGPAWYLLDSPDGSVLAQPVASWRQREHGDVLWLFAPSSPAVPNRLTAVFMCRLADGRHCISESFDAFAEVLSDERIIGQTIGGADLAAQWQAHRAACARHGTVDPSGADDAALAWLADALHAQRVASLVQRRKVYRDSRGLLRPTLAFAWQIYRAMARQPRPPASTEPVPPARLAWLSQVMQRQTQRPVPRRVQAGLFAFSVALFLALGGWFWGLQFALVLFVVVAIHEFGHYLAMRLSGYRNVQMLALPLVGGVTIGHEARPDAARRAWMSLMGPLPGILIGWALLAVWFLGLADAGGLVFQAALVFLLINYLNVLPVPPLDGAHVVQELLPVGSARLSAVFIAVACVVGAVLAFWLGFKLLAFIALLQLPLVKSRWQLGGVLQALRGDPQMAASQPAALRLRRVFEVYDRVVGATAQAPARLALGAEALRSIDVRPMRVGQRVVVGGTYAVLLAGPLLAAVVAIGAWEIFGSAADAAAMLERQAQRDAQFEGEAAKLGVADLLRGIAANEAALDALNGGTAAAPIAVSAAPADEAAIAAAQSRLGATLPADLLAFYRVADGAKTLELAPLADLRRVRDASDIDPASYAYEGRIPLFVHEPPAADDAAPREIALTPADLGSLLVLVGGQSSESVTLYDAGEPPLRAGLRLYSLDIEGGGFAWSGVVPWLRSRWVQSAQIADSAARMDAARERERQAVADWSAARLIEDVGKPSLTQWLLSSRARWGEPAADADLAAVATRFGAPLPDDLAEVYRRHDGIAMLMLLPLAQWQPVSRLDAEAARFARERAAVVSPGIDAAAFDACIAIGGVHLEAPTDLSPGGLGVANLFWCPQAAPERRYLDLQGNRTWRSYTERLRDHVAQRRASRSEFGF